MEEFDIVFKVIHVGDFEQAELVAYKLKGISRVWYDQWKKSRVEGASIIS